MAWRDAEDLWQDPQALPAGSASQEPPKSVGDAGSTDDARAHHGRYMNRWMGDLHLGSDHGTDTEYNHGGAPPRVIQTIIRDSGNTQWTVLTKTNYVEWSSMMKVMIEARRMWNIVCLGDASRHEDRRPLEALLSAVPPEMIPALSGKVTAKDAWDDIATARIDSDRVRKSTLQKLRKEWDHLVFMPGEDVDDFALCLTGLRQ
jgi:hypothetical protein